MSGNDPQLGGQPSDNTPMISTDRCNQCGTPYEIRSMNNERVKLFNCDCWMQLPITVIEVRSPDTDDEPPDQE